MENKVKPIYANNMSIALNSIEAMLLFAVETPSFSKKGVADGGSREIVADIRMNPVFAKQLLKTLQGSLAEYESKYGEIKLQGLNQEVTNE